MKNLIFLTFAVLTAFLLASCGNDTAQTNNVCHTELVAHPLETAIVADQEEVRTGQSISGIVRDHKENVPGYTKQMFLADNPHIASRKPFTKPDPCDPTKVKYTSIPVHAGDTIFLRHPLRIDTIPGNQESINWRPGKYGHRIKHIIDMVDDSNRFTISMQDIVCQPEPVKEESPIFPPKDGGDGENSFGDDLEFGCWSGFGIPWWLWIVLAIIAGAIIVRSGILKGFRGVHERQDTGNDHSDERNKLLQSVIDQGGLRGNR